MLGRGNTQMVEKTAEWKNTCKRFIAFLDILGFKNMVLKNSLNSLYTTLKAFSNTVYDIEQSAKIPVQIANACKKIDKNMVKVIIFSDSIMYVTDDDSVESINDILFSVSAILFKAVQQRIPIKGAIAYGEMTAEPDGSLYFGIPLIDAYELQKELLLYGVVLHDTAEKRFRELGIIEKDKSTDIYKYPVPMKSGLINHYIVNWDWFGSKEEALERVSEFYNDVSGNSRKYVDNTLDFVNKFYRK
jgi:uncharacterized protein YeeX (DUF496 family)